MDSVEKQELHYNHVAEKYYNFRQSKNHLAFKDMLWEYFLKGKFFLKKDRIRVLEPMCGYAEGKKILEKQLGINIDYEGFDISDSFLEMVQKIDPGVKVFREDATKFEPINKYDLIFLVGGLHHVHEYSKTFLNNLYNALNCEGYLINLEPTHDNLFYRFVRRQIYKRNKMFNSETEKDFSLNDLNHLYICNHFQIVDQVYVGLLLYILYYNPEVFPFYRIGNQKIIKNIFNLEKVFYKNYLGRKLSFATLTLLKKNSQ